MFTITPQTRVVVLTTRYADRMNVFCWIYRSLKVVFSSVFARHTWLTSNQSTNPLLSEGRDASPHISSCSSCWIDLLASPHTAISTLYAIHHPCGGQHKKKGAWHYVEKFQKSCYNCPCIACIEYFVEYGVYIRDILRYVISVYDRYILTHACASYID